MSIIICPGIHEPQITESLITELSKAADSSSSQDFRKILVFPEQGILTLSAFHILQFLHDRLGNELKSPVIFISFSAGVVGAIAAAVNWQLLGGHVKAFIAIDGWGVPLWGNFPIHRLSHDYFTHWSSAMLGGGQDNFYADPAVDHLSMWRSPQTVQGRWVDPSIGFSPTKNPLSAAEFLHLLIQHYE
ncbi:hypothetical protein NIES4074_29200 [Cylindrospermum sp. NIES-4074]|nr:hypothetical protein NIES4074_29200 [Cylindrospermum sp. NIES-4074]